jgi:hypothetical protein
MLLADGGCSCEPPLRRRVRGGECARATCRRRWASARGGSLGIETVGGAHEFDEHLPLPVCP